ncbi:hypothetical protein SAMN05444157_0358 [Frankineae bacterium MT45]|nr:hypothetical protein SAMN05444157_0358 [Frankineae bacterium MT45]
MNWTSRGSALRWYAVLIATFFAIRAVTTLVHGASFATPGTGWRSLFQLLAVALLVTGLLRPEWLRACVTAVGALYATATILELTHSDDLLGLIPVDMRDRLVHPLVAVLALVVLAISRPMPARDI